MKRKYKFQIENGHIFDGSFEITIDNYIAEIEETDITSAVLLVIEAHGGQEITKRPKPITTGKTKRKTKPVKWSDEEAVEKVADFMEKVKEKSGVSK